MADLTVNEQIHDDLLRRQIYLSKYTANMQTQMIGLLDNSEGDVRTAIEQRLASLVGADGSFASFGPDTNAQLASLANQLYDIRQAAVGEGIGNLTSDLQDLAGSEAENLDNIINSRSAVTLDTTLPNALQLASIVTSEPMQGRVLGDWASSLAQDDVNQMMDTIRAGMAQGQTTDSIVRDVLGTGTLNGADGVTETTRRNAASITQTAVATTTSEARAAYADANSDILGDEVWVATLDPDTCPICEALDGVHFKVGEGDQTPAHWNCRCVRVPTLDGNVIGSRPYTTATEDQLADMTPEERAQAVKDMTGQVPASMTYQDWLSRQDPEFQDEVLGPARGQMFRDGMPLSRFVQNGDTLTLDELNAKGASTLFVSPNVDNLTFGQAVDGIASDRQQAVLEANRAIDQMLGIESQQTNVIGAWADGAENSIASHVAAGTDYDTLRASAAMKGELANQKAVLLFQEGNGNGSFLGQFTLEGNINDIHEGLLKDGLPFHTLEQLPDGTVKVYVFGQDQDALNALNKAGDIYGKEINVAFGKGEFIGSAIQDGADATVRADAVNQYQATIRSYLDTQPEAVQRAWEGILADWRGTESELPGIKAVGAQEAKQVVDTWISRGGIDSVDTLLANSVSNDALLKSVGTDIEDATGAKFVKGPIKTVDRIEQKIARGKLPGQITDTVRGSFYADTPAAADQIVADLAKRFPVADEDWRLTDSGYFDRTVKIAFPDGTVGEIQIAPPDLFNAKATGGHDLYTQWQASVAKVGADNPETLKLQNQMLNMYSDARNGLSSDWQVFMNSKFGDSAAAVRDTIDTAKVAPTFGVKAVGQEASGIVQKEWIAASPINTVDDLFTSSRINDPLLKLVGKDIAAAVPGADFRAPGIKGLPRTLEKIEAGRTPSGVTDVVRATFQVDTPAAADKVVAELAKRFPIVDERWRMTPFGYFDRPVKVLFPNGQIGEVLVAPPELVAAKSDSVGGGHGLYKQARALPAGDPKLAELADKQRAIYGAARESLSVDWQEVLQHLAVDNVKDKIVDNFTR